MAPSHLRVPPLMFRRTFLRPIALFTLLVQVLSVAFVGPGGGCCLRMWRCGVAAIEVHDQGRRTGSDASPARPEQASSCCSGTCGAERLESPETSPRSISDASLIGSSTFGDGRCDPNPLDDSAPCRIWLPDLAPGVLKELWNGGELSERGWARPVAVCVPLCLNRADGGRGGVDATPMPHRGMRATGDALRATRLRV